VYRNKAPKMSRRRSNMEIKTDVTDIKENKKKTISIWAVPERSATEAIGKRTTVLYNINTYSTVLFAT
jgi:hypothetical protein